MVERGNALAGVLDHAIVLKAAGEAGSPAAQDPLENMLSLASLYWLSAAQLLDSLLSMTRPGKGEPR